MLITTLNKDLQEKFVDYLDLVKLPELSLKDFDEYVGKNYADVYLDIRKKCDPYDLVPMMNKDIIKPNEEYFFVFLNDNLQITHFMTGIKNAGNN